MQGGCRTPTCLFDRNIQGLLFWICRGPPRPTVGPDLRVARVTIDLVGSDPGLTVRRGSKGRPNKKRGCARWRTPLLGRTRATRLAGVRGTNEQPRWLALEQSQRQRALPAASRTLVGLEASQPFQIIQFQHRSHGFRPSGIAPSVSASRGDPNTRSLTFASVQSIEARAIAVGSDLGLTPTPSDISRSEKASASILARLLRLWINTEVSLMTTLTISGADGAGRRDRCHQC